MFVTHKVIATFYPNLKLAILTLYFITISSEPKPYHLLVQLFNLYFTLDGTSELRVGGAIANPDDMMIYDMRWVAVSYT